MLRLPVFNKETPVYQIRFLGTLKISKDNERLSPKITPKETAFIIHLALRAGEPGKSIPVDAICQNFWKNSSRSLRNLSHILLKVKNALCIPPHLLAMVRTTTGSTLCNRGIHFLTDKDEFRQMIASAGAYQRAGEHTLSRMEYLGAFKLFRGAPFVKMYDPWSETQRRIILSSFENAAVHFIKKNKNTGHINEIKRVQMKLKKIIVS
jgi:DNA-binding SARP family transcriptional activator